MCSYAKVNMLKKNCEVSPGGDMKMFPVPLKHACCLHLAAAKYTTRCKDFSGMGPPTMGAVLQLEDC